VVFPQETGKPLKPYFITAEAARDSIAAAELAQKAGKKPVIYTGVEPVTPALAPAAERTRAEPKAKPSIVVQRASAGGNLTLPLCFFRHFLFYERAFD
jgi:hypothetical protein